MRGGMVYGPFPGLAEEQLENGRDLAVTTDLRTAFEAITLFPDFTGGKRLGLFGTL